MSPGSWYVHWGVNVRTISGRLKTKNFEVHSPEPIVKKYKGKAIKLSPLVDETVIRTVPETPLSQVHNCFRQLGLRMVVVGKSRWTGRPAFLKSPRRS